MGSTFVSMKPGTPGPKGDPGSSGGIDNSIDELIEDRAPSQAAVYVALSLKQDALRTSDDLKEGAGNLYHTDQRAQISCVDNIIDPEVSHKAPSQAVVAAFLDAKQDKILSSDEIPEGINNIYFTTSRSQTAALTVCPSTVDVLAALSHKQDLIESSDSFSEGTKNLFFSKERVIDAVNTDYVTHGGLDLALKSKQDLISDSDAIAEGRKNQFYSDSKVMGLLAAALPSRDSKIEKLETKLSEQSESIDFLIKQVGHLYKSLEALGAVRGTSGSFLAIRSISSEGITYQSFRVEEGFVKEMSDESDVKVRPKWL